MLERGSFLADHHHSRSDDDDGNDALQKNVEETKTTFVKDQRSYLLPRSFEFQPCCEKNARAASFPPLALKTSSSSLDHRSMFADFTCEMCTPKLLCTPEQSRHMNTQ